MVALLLVATTAGSRGSWAVWRRALSVLVLSRGAAQVLVGELVCKAVGSISAALVGLLWVLLLLLLLHWLEVGTAWAVAVLCIACKVASWSLWVGILVLLLLLLLLLWSALTLPTLEDWLWEGRWGGREVACVGWGGETVVVVETEEQSLPIRVVIAVLHDCVLVATKLRTVGGGVFVREIDLVLCGAPGPAFEVQSCALLKLCSWSSCMYWKFILS